MYDLDIHRRAVQALVVRFIELALRLHHAELNDFMKPVVFHATVC